MDACQRPSTGQHSGSLVCHSGMDRKNDSNERVTPPGVSDRTKIYDVETPRWSKYYQRMRKHIRFPRYYKKSLNW